MSVEEIFNGQDYQNYSCGTHENEAEEVPDELAQEEDDDMIPDNVSDAESLGDDEDEDDQEDEEEEDEAFEPQQEDEDDPESNNNTIPCRTRGQRAAASRPLGSEPSMSKEEALGVIDDCATRLRRCMGDVGESKVIINKMLQAICAAHLEETMRLAKR
jgi:hypothetical protein